MTVINQYFLKLMYDERNVSHEVVLGTVLTAT